jgi:predicted permease
MELLVQRGKQLPLAHDDGRQILQEVIKQAVESVLTLILMGLLGFLYQRRGLAGPKVKEFIPSLVVKASLPMYLFSTTVRDLTSDEIPELIADAGVAALSIMTTLLISLLVYRIAGVQKARRGIFIVSFAFSNTMFLGMPINLALFGDAALPHVMSYFIFNSFFFWTLGNYLMSLDVPGKPAAILSRATLKRLLQPPVLGFLAGLFAIYFSVPIPSFIQQTASSLGAMTTPLAIMYIGMGMADLSWSSFKPEKDLVLMLGGRFLVCPLVTFLACVPFSLPTLASQVFLIQSSLPVVASCSIMAGYYHSDTALAVKAVSFSTLLSIVTVPFFRILTSLF